MPTGKNISTVKMLEAERLKQAERLIEVADMDQSFGEIGFSSVFACFPTNTGFIITDLILGTGILIFEAVKFVTINSRREKDSKVSRWKKFFKNADPRTFLKHCREGGTPRQVYRNFCSIKSAYTELQRQRNQDPNPDLETRIKWARQDHQYQQDQLNNFRKWKKVIEDIDCMWWFFAILTFIGSVVVTGLRLAGPGIWIPPAIETLFLASLIIGIVVGAAKNTTVVVERVGFLQPKYKAKQALQELLDLQDSIKQWERPDLTHSTSQTLYRLKQVTKPVRVEIPEVPEIQASYCEKSKTFEVKGDLKDQREGASYCIVEFLSRLLSGNSKGKSALTIELSGPTETVTVIYDLLVNGLGIVSSRIKVPTGFDRRKVPTLSDSQQAREQVQQLVDNRKIDLDSWKPRQSTPTRFMGRSVTSSQKPAPVNALDAATP